MLEHEAGTGIDAFSWRQRRRGTIVVRQRGLCPRPVRAFRLANHVDDARPNRGERAGYFPKELGKDSLSKMSLKNWRFHVVRERCNCGAFVDHLFTYRKQSSMRFQFV